MKCGYCNSDVPKEEAVKDGRYYHKECYRKKIGKKEIEEYWLAEINKGTVLQLLRKFIKDFVEIYDVDYVLWALKKTKADGVRLQYPQGLKKILDNSTYKDGWKKEKILEEYAKVKDVEMESGQDVIFEYNPVKNKRITDII